MLKTYQHTRPHYRENRKEDFKKHSQKLEVEFAKLGRFVIVSEQMAYWGQPNKFKKQERANMYLHHFKSIVEQIQLKELSTNIKDVSMVTNNKQIFEELKPRLMTQLDYVNKYVAIVNGKLAGKGDKKSQLVKEMYKKFGNVEMFVDKISSKPRIGIIDTPEI